MRTWLRELWRWFRYYRHDQRVTLLRDYFKEEL